MVLREGALALEARGHRRLEQLGQLAQLAPRLGVVDALARVDDRPLGRHQRRRHRGHGLRVGAEAHARRGDVAERLGHLFLEDVDRDLDQDRARAPVLDLGEGAPERVGHGVGHRHLLDPLGDVPVVDEGVEVRRDVGDAPRVAARQDDDGHGVAVGLRHAAEGVLGAGPVLHREDADLLPRGDAAHGVGHVQARALLAHDDGADVGLGGGLDDGVDGIADEELDAFTLQDLRDRRDRLHEVSFNRGVQVTTPDMLPCRRLTMRCPSRRGQGEGDPMTDSDIIWRPTPERIERARLTKFMRAHGARLAGRAPAKERGATPSGTGTPSRRTWASAG